MSPAGEGLRDRFVRETEQCINRLRERREELEFELLELSEKEEEARAMLQLLKQQAPAVSGLRVVS